jgi:alpha-1,2-mannosyltransferase
MNKILYPKLFEPRWMPWIIGGIGILVFVIHDALMTDHGVIDHAVLWGRDFINVWTGGHLVREGRIDTIYNLHDYAQYQRNLLGDIGPHNYSYPPLSFPLAAFISCFPYGLAYFVWIIGTGTFFGFAARPWWPKEAGWPVLAVLTPAALVNIWAGHYGFLVGGLFLLGWQRLDDRPIQAGIFFGLLLIKPHLAVLIPLVLLLRREWSAFASAAGSVIALILVTALVYGPVGWYDYFFRTLSFQAGMIDPQGMFFRMMSPSVASAVFQLNGGWAMALLAQTVMASYALTLIALAVKRGIATQPLALLVATCTFLVLPYSFNYDLTVVMIGALAVMVRPGLSGLEFRLALFGFMSPQLGMIAAVFSAPVMSVMLAGLALVQFRVASRDAGFAGLHAFPANTDAAHLA